MSPHLPVAVSFAVLVSLIPNAAVANAGAVPLPDQERVAIESFRGPQAQRLQGAVETGLMGRFYLVPDFSVEQMARQRGVALRDPQGMAEVGRALQVRAFLSAEVTKRRAWQVRVLVRRGDTGEAIGRFVVADRRLDQLESTLAARTSRRVGAMLAKADSVPALAMAGNSLAPPAARADAEASVVQAATDLEDEGAGRSLPGEVVEVKLQSRIFNRSFIYNQNLSGLSDYQLEGAVSLALGGTFHPLALISEKLAPIGVSAGLEYGLGVGSRVAGSEKSHSTDVHGYSVGLAYRVRIGDSEVTPVAGYSLSTFDAGTSTSAPNVDYRLLRGGLDGRWAINERFSALGRAEYLHVVGAGPLATAPRFPRMTARGVEASLAVGFSVMEEFEIEAGIGLRRLGITTGVVPGDRWVAGGAVDESKWMGLGVSYRPTLARAD